MKPTHWVRLDKRSTGQDFHRERPFNSEKEARAYIRQLEESGHSPSYITWGTYGKPKRKPSDPVVPLAPGPHPFQVKAKDDLKEAAAAIKQAEAVLDEFPDYSDVIHTDPRTWGEDHPVPTRRPWHLSKGVGDDDHSGSYHEDGRPRTNKEFEEFLDEARANGQVVHLRTQEGRQRAPGNDAWANSFNRKIRKEEQDQYRSHSPNGCPCIYCKAKQENAAERKRQRQAR